MCKYFHKNESNPWTVIIGGVEKKKSRRSVCFRSSVSRIPLSEKTAASGWEERRNEPSEHGERREKKTGAQRGGREHAGEEVSDTGMHRTGKSRELRL